MATSPSGAFGADAVALHRLSLGACALYGASGNAREKWLILAPGLMVDRFFVPRYRFLAPAEAGEIMTCSLLPVLSSRTSKSTVTIEQAPSEAGTSDRFRCGLEAMTPSMEASEVLHFPRSFLSLTHPLLLFPSLSFSFVFFLSVSLF